ncbi:hypothetical protein Mmc1_2303 [Magnetococcus marinus MC-1]|uniref:Uncharacterized protein n=1 Tax=Magnetococcus marinus (strain ATCC BAA-1437 / JCM 17883 / MC-1) TaxID=156889 RepID=A0LA10_MAGMM|nr:hypothetical protein [Magnetococcus marinus]ABK44803.1 hypothetical protein Mmc1_2303 [Magnetococcus marinus MC-1]
MGDHEILLFPKAAPPSIAFSRQQRATILLLTPASPPKAPYFWFRLLSALEYALAQAGWQTLRWTAPPTSTTAPLWHTGQLQLQMAWSKPPAWWENHTQQPPLRLRLKLQQGAWQLLDLTTRQPLFTCLVNQSSQATELVFQHITQALHQQQQQQITQQMQHLIPPQKSDTYPMHPTEGIHQTLAKLDQDLHSLGQQLEHLLESPPHPLLEDRHRPGRQALLRSLLHEVQHGLNRFGKLQSLLKSHLSHLQRDAPKQHLHSLLADAIGHLSQRLPKRILWSDTLHHFPPLPATEQLGQRQLQLALSALFHHVAPHGEVAIQGQLHAHGILLILSGWPDRARFLEPEALPCNLHQEGIQRFDFGAQGLHYAIFFQTSL